MNAKLVTFMLLVPSAVLMGSAVLVGETVWGFSDESFDRPPAHAAARDYDEDSGPFTREEARRLRDVWSTIREAENFHDINWRSVGLDRAPGDREARRFMADDWGSLRRAERFDDINWRAEYHRR